MDKLSNEVKRLQKINRCTKNVLRVPRLYRAFHDEMENIVIRERAEAAEKNMTVKEILKVGELDEIETKTVLTALKYQFEADYDWNELKARVLQNIDVDNLKAYPTKEPFIPALADDDSVFQNKKGASNVNGFQDKARNIVQEQFRLRSKRRVIDGIFKNETILHGQSQIEEADGSNIMNTPLAEQTEDTVRFSPTDMIGQSGTQRTSLQEQGPIFDYNFKTSPAAVDGSIETIMSTTRDGQLDMHSLGAK